jgi:hypothetical protein
MTTVDPRPPIVRAAITSLDLFGAVSRQQAFALLGMWARRAELDEAQVEEVLSHYPSRSDSGWWVPREEPEQTGGPLPEGIEGWHIRRGNRW